MEYFDTPEEKAKSNTVSFIWRQKFRMYTANRISESRLLNE